MATPAPYLFQSTRPRGARPAPARLLSIRGGFNPRAHAGRDPVEMADPAFVLLFQSTRPRGARLTCWNDEEAIRLVSIHAPARGATSVNIHNTVLLERMGSPEDRFNPRARAGRDTDTLLLGVA